MQFLFMDIRGGLINKKGATMRPKSKAKLPHFVAGNCASCALFRERNHPDCKECLRLGYSANPKPMWREAAEDN